MLWHRRDILVLDCKRGFKPYLCRCWRGAKFGEIGQIGLNRALSLVDHVLPLFNLVGLWWLQHSVAAELLFLKQPHNEI